MAAYSRIIKSLRKAGKKTPVCSAVIAAAGASQRMGGEDKLFAEICGAPVLAHTLKAFQAIEGIGEIIIVAREDSIERVGHICKTYGISKAAKIMVGGSTRQESVFIGVLAVSQKAELIAIHDGARPCVCSAEIETALSAAAKYHAAAPAVRIGQTIKRAKDGLISETVDREDLFEAQTPQVFTAEVIKAAHTKAAKKSICVTDDCQAAEMIGVPVRLTEGSRSNIKVTEKEDLIIAEAILLSRNADSGKAECGGQTGRPPELKPGQEGFTSEDWIRI